MAGARHARRCLLVGVLACLALSPAALARTVTETDTRNATVAALTYEFERSDYTIEYTDFRLGIARAGSLLLDGGFEPICEHCRVLPAGFGKHRSVHVRDLDANDEPEVLIDLYWGGAHCCVYSYVFTFDPAAGRYDARRHLWGNPHFVGGNGAYRLRDLDRDERLELVGKDDRFSYAFTSYADSVSPIRIWHLADGNLRDVSRRFRAAARRDARRVLRIYRRARRKGWDVRGVLAAYLADKYLAGERRSGWRVLRAANRRGELHDPYGFSVWPNDERYLRALRRFLKRTGYA